MTDTNLPWLLWGRRIRPFALAAMLSTAIIAVGLFQHVLIGSWLDRVPGFVIGLCALAVVVLLMVGWLLRSEKAMVFGLFGATGVWAAVAVTLAAEGVNWVNWALAGCWAVASGGAYLLEVVNARVAR